MEINLESFTEREKSMFRIYKQCVAEYYDYLPEKAEEYAYAKILQNRELAKMLRDPKSEYYFPY